MLQEVSSVSAGDWPGPAVVSLASGRTEVIVNAKRLHHNVLATALANKLARIAWTVLAQGRSYERRAVPGIV